MNDRNVQKVYSEEEKKGVRSQESGARIRRFAGRFFNPDAFSIDESQMSFSF